ncbi:MAG: hypothetical protein R2765_00370 [Ferruginibacter sp.]
MSLDNIQLPACIIAGLYNKSLYDLKPYKPVQVNDNDEKLLYLGENLKHVTIIVDNNEAIYLPDEQLSFLLDILTACKLKMADVSVINLSKNLHCTYKEISNILKSEIVLLFGLHPDAINLPLQIPHYQVQKFNNQVFLSSESLSQLQKDKSEKLKLWNCLKKIFSI